MCPDFGNGAVVALVMIIPSVVSITVLHILEKYNVRYNKISPIELKKGRKRDAAFAVLSAVILLGAFSVFRGNVRRAFCGGVAVPDDLYHGACTGGV